MAEKEKPCNEAGVEKTHIVGLGFISQGSDGNATVADEKGGKIIRFRPPYYDWQYKPASHGYTRHLLGLLADYTEQARNPYSWEGWWSANHVWGKEMPQGIQPNGPPGG